MFCFECYQKGYASRAKVSKHVVIKRKEQNAEPSKDARIHILNNTGLTIQIYKELIQLIQIIIIINFKSEPKPEETFFQERYIGPRI